MADAVTGTVSELMVTRDALQKLSRAWRQRHTFRDGSSAALALDLLPHYPVITIKRLAALLAVSIPAATAAARQLSDHGILAERTGYRRNKVFVAHEALSIINRPFGVDPLAAHGH